MARSGVAEVNNRIYFSKIYEGRPPSSTSSTPPNPPGPNNLWRDTMHGDNAKHMTSLSADEIAPTPLYMTFEAPKLFSGMLLSVSLKVVSGKY